MSARSLLAGSPASIRTQARAAGLQRPVAGGLTARTAGTHRRFAIAIAPVVMAVLALAGCGGQGARKSTPVEDKAGARAEVTARAPRYETEDGVLVQALPSGETSATPLPSQTVAAVSPELTGADPALAATGRRANPAVTALLRDADAATAVGAHDRAAASIERALKVEPRDPELWRRLAQAKLAQGQATQAENLARRSSSLAPGNRALLVSNWQLIAAARDARGDGIGANEALAAAAALE